MSRTKVPFIVPISMGDLSAGLNTVRREIDQIWRAVRDLTAEKPDFDKADDIVQVETAIFNALDNIHLLEDHVTDIEQARIEAEIVTCGHALGFTEEWRTS